MSSPHILISSTYYWPEATGNAPYVTGLAEHLVKRDYRVTVLTGFPHYPAWQSTSGRRAAAREERNGVHVERRWHYVPQSATASRRALYEGSIASTGWTAFRPRLKPDAVLAVVPTLAAGLLGSVASRTYRAPFGLIFQDLMGPASTQNGLKAARWLSGSLSKVEIAIARSADQVGVITEGFRGYLEQRGVSPHKVSPVRNWAHAGEATEARPVTRARLGWGPDEFIALHSGNMGQKQGLDNLLAAADSLQRMGSRRIRIVLAGDGNDRRRLEAEAARMQLRNVTFLPFQADEQAFGAMLAAADLLVVHQRASLTSSALPSKLTSYFNSGGAVLAVAAPESQAAVEVERSGGGIVIPPGDPQALACQLLLLSNDLPALRCMGERAREYATTHLGPSAALADYERLVTRLLEAKR